MHRLPHQPPIRFVTQILDSQEQSAKCQVSFSSKPTLAMIIEAAAQSSVYMKLTIYKEALGIKSGELVQGMLLKMSAKQRDSLHSGKMIISTSYVANYRHFFEINFEAVVDTHIVADGKINILLGDES